MKIKDRSKDIIISGGENISSIEVEDALYRHPAVLACAVVARPDAKWGETPLAFVELKPGPSVTAAELIAHCKSLLAGYKVPREVRFEPIPKTSTGKIQKFMLREPGQSRPARSNEENAMMSPNPSVLMTARRARRRHAHAEPPGSVQRAVRGHARGAAGRARRGGA